MADSPCYGGQSKYSADQEPFHSTREEGIPTSTFLSKRQPSLEQTHLLRPDQTHGFIGGIIFPFQDGEANWHIHILLNINMICFGTDLVIIGTAQRNIQ